MNKKKLFGIVLFIVIGLFMFTFANPNEPVDEANKQGSNQQEQTEEKNENLEQGTTDENIEDKIIEEEIQPITVPVNNNETVLVVDLSSDKLAAKEEILHYANELSISKDNLKDEIVNSSNNRIDSATTKEEIAQIVEESKNQLDELKKQENLQNAINTAIEEIKNYRNDYPYTNGEEYNNLLNEIIKNIENSKTLEEVSINLEDGKKLIDEFIQKDLNGYKELKKQELQVYKDLLEFTDFNSEASNIVLDSFKEIDESQSKEAIDMIVETTISKLDELKRGENLQNAINTAIEEIKNYRNDYPYTNVEEYNDLLNEIIKNIENSKTLEEVNVNLEDGKRLIDEFIQNDLEQYKEKAIEEIKQYNSSELYSEENEKLISSIKENAINEIQTSLTKETIDQIVEATKKEIDSIKKLTETIYNVDFIGLNGTLLKREQVLYGKDASQPVTENVTLKGVTYTFTGWDTDYTKVTSDLVVKANYTITKVVANILLDEKLLEVIELNVDDTIIETIDHNVAVTLTTNEEEMKNFVKGTLPTLDKQNYKYQFISFNYDETGFNIKALEVIDEEELRKNTVTVTYTIANDGYVFDDNTTSKTTTVTNGKNVVSSLPKVYKNQKEVAVIWKDANDNVISNITTNRVNLNHEITYTSSMTLTAYLDETKPVITLNGEEETTIDLSLTDEYLEPGYVAIDNYDGDITSLVEVNITYNGVSINQVDYSNAGTYVITYSVTDSSELTSSVTRTITVVDPIKEIKAGIFVLKEGVERPENKDATPVENYTKIGEINLVIDSVRKYLNGPKTIISNTNIESYVIGNLPTLNDPYYYYEYYVIKYEKDGFHIDCQKMFDLEKYTNDKKRELNELLNKDYSEYEQTKTTDSYQHLLDSLETGKQANTLEEIETAIDLINSAINNLVDVELIKIELSSNNDIYYLNDKMKSIEVKAIYNDSTRNKIITDYNMSNNFDTTTVGEKTITYRYENKQVVYYYTVNYSSSNLNKLVSDIEITLDKSKKCEGKKCDTIYTITFEKLKNMNVKNIEIIKNDKVLKTISFTYKNNNILTISKEDYQLLRENNTVFGNKEIRITYVVNKQEISANYYEVFGKLNRL